VLFQTVAFCDLKGFAMVCGSWQRKHAQQLLEQAERAYQLTTSVRGSDINGAKITAMLEEILKIRKADADAHADGATGSNDMADSAAAAVTSSDDDVLQQTLEQHGVGGAASSSNGGRGVSASSAATGSKIIIFSPWGEVLERIATGLRLNNIACAHPSGFWQDDSGLRNDANAQLEHFKTSNETFVLLLLVDEGAVSRVICVNRTPYTPSILIE
jgi:hypothetical protein